MLHSIRCVSLRVGRTCGRRDPSLAERSQSSKGTTNVNAGEELTGTWDNPRESLAFRQRERVAGSTTLAIVRVHRRQRSLTGRLF
jgi:hypothetical protein